MGRNMPFSPELDYILFQSTRYSGFREFQTDAGAPLPQTV